MTREFPTPPVTKWLANEIAALTGELQKIDDSLRHLTERRKQVVEALQGLSATAGLLGTPRLGECVPPVQAHQRYGARGSRREFIVRVLQAAPEGVPSVVLTRMAIEAFGISVATGAEFRRLHNDSLVRALRKMEKRGLVEKLPAPAKNATVTWRWKGEFPTLDALREVAEEPTGEGDNTWR